MPGTYFNVICLLGVIAEVYVVVCLLYRRNFLRELAISSYMVAAALVTGGLVICIMRFGVASLTYKYYYYYSDSLLTVLMFWVIIRFYREVFQEMHASRYVQIGAVLLLLATAFFSFLVVTQNRDHLTSRFVVELGQNLYFVGLVLTYLLWGAILKVRESRMRLIQLVLALGVYFSSSAATYAIRHLFPDLYMPFLRYVLPAVGTWLPLAWAYTFTKVPGDARLAAGALLARARS